jgi:uncharacterized protein YkwD
VTVLALAAAALLALLNADRVALGAPALAWDAEMAPMAALRAEQVCAPDGFTHGPFLYDDRHGLVLGAFGRLIYGVLPYRRAYESIWRHPADAAQAHAAFAASPEHQAIRTDADLTLVAIGTQPCGDGETAWIELFRALDDPE